MGNSNHHRVVTTWIFQHLTPFFKFGVSCDQWCLLSTLQGTNITPTKALLKIFLFPRWDMLVPRRVYQNHSKPASQSLPMSTTPRPPMTGDWLHVAISYVCILSLKLRSSDLYQSWTILKHLEFMASTPVTSVHMGVSKNRGTPKMDGENNGKP